MARQRVRLSAATGFLDNIKQGWSAQSTQPDLPAGAAAAAAEHRRRLVAELPGRRIAVASGRAPVRANDTYHDFRPDSDFVWLTGCNAEGAVLVITPTADGHDAVLYLAEPAGPELADFFADPHHGALWNGPQPGLAEWSEALGLTCLPLERLADSLRGMTPPTMVVTGVDPLLDAVGDGRGGAGEVRRVCSELRRIKDDWEIGQLREAVDATIGAFGDVAAALPAAIEGGGERWLQGTFDRVARSAGNGPGYATIVASGPNAPVLHWVRCDGPVRPDHLVLLDAGVEVKSCYTADVTRTFPASGTFSAAQRQVYDLVTAAHLAAIEEVRPGRDYLAFHDTALRVLAEGLHDWGLLPVSVDEAMDPNGQQHRRFIVCGIGHYLGIDVHDSPHASAAAYHGGTLEERMVLTVEPGLYFHPNDETVPPELRGIGVRTEDDLLVTSGAPEVLSSELPIHSADIERWVRDHQS
ncbi:aminopeptidase P family protein [Actinoalloteichus hymeniacidonis]|uniref:Xaa-Pro aminopeptidase n=1 Tax=Actinoalloteichus hymeniacidonis TaxID=340345 RepID=A0AAC9HMH7_9PSEU|nr:aminopeptidase P family protein [Actinoalloteichus hymeniacidonis]AOS62037.1 Xaa-Pro aminopeptidase [Actinoalloteichus hymeniacidonis]MBB5909941.1 Xaa-Pro aminopeptidase [Actinoalloteichus hymeniacidonis]